MARHPAPQKEGCRQAHWHATPNTVRPTPPQHLPGRQCCDGDSFATRFADCGERGVVRPPNLPQAGRMGQKGRATPLPRRRCPTSNAPRRGSVRQRLEGARACPCPEARVWAVGQPTRCQNVGAAAGFLQGFPHMRGGGTVEDPPVGTNATAFPPNPRRARGAPGSGRGRSGRFGAHTEALDPACLPPSGRSCTAERNGRSCTLWGA